MLVKEYRICLPLTVDEYRIAQLYMIQKKSQEETTGQGSGVEIIKNEPYEDGPGGSGQYTFKIYHVGSHLPNWFRNILPKSALIVEEEAWNSYPYTKTRYRVPLIEKFMIEIETCYHNDAGVQDNVFQLNDEEMRQRSVDYLDIVSDPISSGDYRVEEDPKIYKSTVTKRGPLKDDWRTAYQNEIENASGSNKSIMCAYKLCRIEFKYWGMQTKIEKFIDDIGLRKTMLRAHRQAWCWQDEWYGLTIEDIRNLEAEAQRVLAEKMHLASLESGQVSLNTNKSHTTNETNKEPNLASPSQLNIESIQREDSVSSTEDTQNNEDEDDSFTDARSEFPSETDSYMTCKNRFDSNLTLNIDPCTGNLLNSPSSPGKKVALFLVVHGGSLLDTNHEYHNKNSDVGILRQTFEQVIRIGYPSLKDRFSLKLVACPSSVTDIMNNLNKLTPQMCDQKYSSTLSNQHYVPLAAIPLFLTNSSHYKILLENVKESINDRYHEFIRHEGNVFDGQISIIADSLGSLFVYDILNLSNQNNFNESSQTLDNDNISNSKFSIGRKLSNRSKHSPSITSQIIENPLDFQIQDIFMLGTPLGLVLSHRSLLNESSQTISPPVNCRHLFNMFHLTDPSAYRVEPLINSRFHRVPPMKIPNFTRNPHGNDESCYLIETLFNNPSIVDSQDDKSLMTTKNDVNNNKETHLTSFLKLPNVNSAINSWWGEKRIDFGLHCPEGVQSFPLGALPHLLHASYWESRDSVAFIIRQTIDSAMKYRDDNDFNFELDSTASLDAGENDALDKIIRTKTRISSFKFKSMCVPYRINVSANHRANDVIVLTGQPQILSARFMYGTLDIVTPKNEKVDVYLMSQPISHGHWEKEGTEVTDSNGRIQFHVPESRRLPEGMYPVRMVLRSDFSAVDFHLAVLPPNVETVVFSIDGSFAASVSISGKDPKIRAGCIDVTRFWQEKGYLLVYISARPSLQQRHVQRWLAQHKFPFGMLIFSDGVSREPLKQKMMTLSRLINEVQMKIHCAYGSAKDISIYQNLGLHPHQIFSLGKLTRSQKNNSLSIKRGYAIHLNDLQQRKDISISKPSKSLVNISFKCTSFELPIRYVNLNTLNFNSFNTIESNATKKND